MTGQSPDPKKHVFFLPIPHNTFLVNQGVKLISHLNVVKIPSNLLGENTHTTVCLLNHYSKDVAIGSAFMH